MRPFVLEQANTGAERAVLAKARGRPMDRVIESLSHRSSADGLVVMIERCQRLDPGSIPGRRTLLFSFCFLLFAPQAMLPSR